MSNALWLLAGVILTAGFGLAKDWLLQDRRTSLEWQREREDELRAARVACLLIADELDTHAQNYALMARIGRSPARQVTSDSPFLGSVEWEAHKLALARIEDRVPPETWKGLTHAYHNARSLRGRIQDDGPNQPFPEYRIAQLKEHEIAAAELSKILTDAAPTIRRELRERQRSWTYRGRLEKLSPRVRSRRAELEGDADERT